MSERARRDPNENSFESSLIFFAYGTLSIDTKLKEKYVLMQNQVRNNS
jgi:hypothetical protein